MATGTLEAINREIRLAHQAVARAVERGDLPHISMQACTDCGDRAQAYHHNQGYAGVHHLSVIPLCAPCHRARHHGEKHRRRVITPTGFVTMTEAEEDLGVSRATLARLVKTHELQVYRDQRNGRVRLLKTEDLAQLKQPVPEESES